MANERVSNALVSVVMPCCGQLEYTRLAVPRLLRHSRPPFEVLFVDAGSLDGTAEYLEGIAAAAPVQVEVVRGHTDTDFPDIVAQAVARARGSFIAWLNNDVLVSELWLQQLLALVTANEVIGVVGPMANVAPEQQRVSSVPYRLARPRAGTVTDSLAQERLETQAVDRFAQEFRQANHGQWAELERIGGFCWLARRDVVERAGLHEQGAEEGAFDANQFSVRVRRAGSRLACCRDLYVHHFGANLISQ